MKSEGNTIKLHMFLRHFTDSIYRLGHPRHYHASPYEARHVMTKALARAGNFKLDGEGQLISHMVEVQRRNEVAKILDDELQGQTETEKKQYNTAHKQASTHGVDMLFGDVQKVAYLSLETKGNKYTKALPEALRKYSSRHDVDPYIHIYKSAIVRAVPDGEANFSILQTIRACNSFHRRPCYDSVQYLKSNSNAPQYGVLRCLFTVSIQGEQKPDDMTSEEYREYSGKTKLALVQRLTKQADQRGMLAAMGNTALQWPGSRATGSYVPEYEVVPLCDIVKRIYLVPNFAKGENRFYHNVLKWDRTDKDARRLVDIEGHSTEGGRYNNGIIKNVW